MISKAIANVSLSIIALGITVLVMIYGWGLTPKSWPWIILGGIGARLIVAIMEAVVKADK